MILLFIIFLLPIILFKIYNEMKLKKNNTILNYSDFDKCENNDFNFKFKRLHLIEQQQNCYIQKATLKKYQITILPNSGSYNILHNLQKKECFGNIAGFLKKNGHYYCFSSIENYQTLVEYVENSKGQKDFISELFCLQLVEGILQAARSIEIIGHNLKVISPNDIILIQAKNGQYKFRLSFPLSYQLFQTFSQEVVQDNIQFCSPEILANIKNASGLKKNKFSKSILYSVGLILLYCFGYRIKSEERVLALKNSKEFNIFLKAIRKQIKIFQDGKFICKIIKILMEQSQSVRDTIQTFLIKLSSPHLQSLRKFIFKPQLESQKQVYIPTIYSDYSDQTRKSNLNRTIQIHLSSLTSSQNKTHQKSQHQNEDHLSIDFNPLFATFRKSPDNLKCREKIEEVEEDGENQSYRCQIPSPIEIQIDWEEDQDNNRELTPKKDNKSSLSKIEEFQEEGLKITIRNCQLQKSKGKQRFLYTQERPSKSFNEYSKRSRNSQISKSFQRNNQLQPQVQSKLQLQNHISQHSSPIISIKNGDKYHVMVQQQPQIIKYSQNQYNIRQSPKLSKKRSTSKSVDLQDMTLNKEQQEEQQQYSQQSFERIGTNYVQIKKEFRKKSQAIFITLLISFLIYKLIDYFVK